LKLNNETCPGFKNRYNRVMKIAVFTDKSSFTPDQQRRLATLGKVVYSNSSENLSDDKLVEIASDSEIIAPDPDNFGGFETARPKLTRVMKSLPNLQAVCLSTTSFGWVDLEYCRKREIKVSNVPGYSRESVAEHTLAMLLCLAKQIILTDRRTQQGKYKLEMGTELKGKTLGIIGLGNIGSRVAELGLGMGMNVVAFNRSPKKQTGVEMVSLDELLKQADAISLHTTHEDGNKNLLDKRKIAKMKKGVLIVNTVDRELIDETELARALRSGQVGGYAYEAEDLKKTPLANLENVVDLRGFGWYTKEALANLYEIWAENIVAATSGKPRNLIK